MKGNVDFYPVECYVKLSNAVIKRAVMDYRDAKAILTKRPNSMRAQDVVKSVNKFFHSPLFSVYTSLDGSVLWTILEKEPVNPAQRVRVDLDSLRNS